MELNINELKLQLHPSSNLLIDYLKSKKKELKLENSIIYYDLPLYLTPKGASRSDVMIIDQSYGILLFKCIANASKKDLEEGTQKLEEIDSLVFSKLIRDPRLKASGRKLKIDITRILFSSAKLDEKVEFPIEEIDFKFCEEETSLDNLFLKKLSVKKYDKTTTELSSSILEGAISMSRHVEREYKNPSQDTKARLMEEINAQIKVFDLDQKESALKIVNGPQRIRGLAGSGKTIVLTMKAALIHFDDPNAKMVYTYSTKNLKGFIKKLITYFYREYAGEDPNWDKIKIMHSWGGRTLDGVYYSTCLNNNVSPVTFKEASREVRLKDTFDFACDNFLKNCKAPLEEYDYMLLDEAQDYPPSFYKLCVPITKGNKIIWGYDECQNIFDMEIQDLGKTFGNDEDGNPIVKLDRDNQDIVLHKCYRTPRKIIISAFGIGTGISSNKITQLPEHKDHWEDLGFQVTEGKYTEGEVVSISRENEPALSPRGKLDNQDLIKWKKFSSMDEECKYVAQKIKEDLEQDLNPEEIAVISLDDRYAKAYFKQLSEKLDALKIDSFNLSTASWTNTEYKIKNHVTLSTVYKAKGNESTSVYIIGIDRVFDPTKPLISRNKIFTSMTRTKGWLTITGAGENADIFISEIEKLKKDNFVLKFSVPNQATLRTMSLKRVKDAKTKETLNKLIKEGGYTPEQLTKMMG